MKANLGTFESPSAVASYENTGYRANEKEVLDRYIKQENRILVLGCGTGRSSKFLAERGFDPLSTDYSAPMIESAKKRHPHLRFEVADASSLRYANASFDVVLFPANGLDYLYPEEKRLEAMREAARVLEPGGVFIFSAHRSKIPRTMLASAQFLVSLLRGQAYPYRYEQHIYGPLLTHFGSVARHAQQLTSAGLSLIDVLGPAGTYPMYVTKKV